jgi:hypothetical protein
MSWSNLSIDTEINNIIKISAKLKGKDESTSDALNNVASALKKIKAAVENIAYRAYGN